MLDSLNNRLKSLILIPFLLATSLNLYANQNVARNGEIDGIEVVGEKSVSISIKPKQSLMRSFFASEAPPITKEIKVLDIEISNSLKQELVEKAQDIQEDLAVGAPPPAEIGSSASVDLGMNNVPVLDQGAYGTCVTFSNTALIDALMGSGDFISQQCLLELGVYKQKQISIKSGWDGLNSSTVVLDRIKNYGIIDKQTCPHSYADSSLQMDDQSYLNYSNKLWANNVNWTKLERGNLEQVKQALNNGHRVSTATILHANQILGDGINGNWSGLWQLPTNVNQFISEINNGYAAGHAVIIIGYDDAKGLLKLRNSWSTAAGDQGDFYMTYDFYKLLNIESIEVY